MARRRRRATPAEGCLLTLGSSGIRRHRLDCTNVSDGSSAPPPRIAHTVGTAAALPHVGWKAQDGRYNFRVGSYVSGLPQTLAMRTYPFASRARDVYAFGVYTGMSLRRLADKLPAFGQLWAFDSFQGLPAEPAHESHWSPWFRKGGYSAADAYDQHNLGRLIGSVHDLVRRPNTTYVPGFFNQTLTAALLRLYPFQPALFVDIDCDLFTSTWQALDWLFGSKLIVPSTFLRYDDWPIWNATNGADKGTTNYGEKKAHDLITAKYQVGWRRVGLGNAREHRATAAFQVVSIGSWQCGQPCSS